MKLNCVLLLLFSFAALQVFSQTKHTISGTIRDSKNGETIIGATISFTELKGIGAKSNTYGFYSITIPDGNYEMRVSSIGFLTQTKRVTLSANQKIDIQLEAQSNSLKEVKISSVRKDRNVRDAQMGVEKLNMTEINKIPVFAGERDIIKTITLLPGVKNAGEGSSGFNVRGGNVDQNLILLDEGTVYNAAHLLGFFSTFNSDAIKDVQLYKGGMPAEYGGRLSSVLDVKMKEGNDKKYSVGGGLGLIASRLNIEGPIVKEKGSFLIAGRRTYADQFLKLSDDFKDNRLFFYDLNAKANYKLNKNNRLYMSGYFGRDEIGVGKAFGIDWGNTTFTTRWNHLYNAKLFSNTSIIYSNFDYKIAISGGDVDFDITSRIKDINLKHEFNYYPNPKNSLKIGINTIHHTIVPGQVNTNGGSGINPLKLQDRYSLESALYAMNEWKPNNKLSILYGLRLSSFAVLGKGDYKTFNADGDVVSSKNYKSGEVVKHYFNPEPRISMSYVLDTNKSIKLAYNRNVQNLHLISNSTTSSPTDLWTSSSNNVKPEIGDQISVGYFQNSKNNDYEFSVEAYYKNMQNQIDYKNGANTQANENLEAELLTGIGRAYGIEFLAKKKVGTLTGWLGYTLSKSERKIKGINFDNWYNARQDRTHDITLVAIYDLTKKWNVSSTWTYQTGNAVTYPTGKYSIAGQTVPVYSERNAERFPAYHRLDIGATYYRKRTDKRESSWNFSVYNAYGRENAFTIAFKEDPNDKTKSVIERTALFRWIPAITYNFKF